jgi:hypothetical protein
VIRIEALQRRQSNVLGQAPIDQKFDFTKLAHATAATLGNLFFQDAVHHFQIKTRPGNQSATSLPALTITT